MKKFILSTFALLLTLATIIPAQAKLGYQGENPIITEGTLTSATRFGHRDENPTTNPNWKQEQRERQRMQEEDRRRAWNKQHKGTRANQGSTARAI